MADGDGAAGLPPAHENLPQPLVLCRSGGKTSVMSALYYVERKHLYAANSGAAIRWLARPSRLTAVNFRVSRLARLIVVADHRNNPTQFR